MVTNLKVVKAELATACLACRSFISLSLKFLSVFIHNMHMQITRNKKNCLPLAYPAPAFVNGIQIDQH